LVLGHQHRDGLLRPVRQDVQLRMLIKLGHRDLCHLVGVGVDPRRGVPTGRSSLVSAAAAAEGPNAALGRGRGADRPAGSGAWQRRIESVYGWARKLTLDECLLVGDAGVIDPQAFEGESAMGKVTSHQTVTADGFAAGPNQSEDRPFGEDGGDGWGNTLHGWMFEHADENREELDRLRL